MHPESPEDALPSRELDLRAERCPLTFVKTRLTLETMEIGQALRVLLRDPESVRNVPRSLEAEGCDVYDEAQHEDRFSFLVQKTKLTPW